MRHVNDRKHAEKMQELYQKHRTAVVRHAYSLIQNRAAAEDICQEAFLRLDKKLHKVPPEKVKAWLFTTTGRLTLDYLRKMGKEEVSSDAVEEKRISFYDEYTEPERILERMERTGEYKRALEYLKKEKPHWYRVISMSYLEEMSNHEIARELGISANLVSQWKHRASAWLREVYKRKEEMDT